MSSASFIELCVSAYILCKITHFVSTNVVRATLHNRFGYAGEHWTQGTASNVLFFSPMPSPGDQNQKGLKTMVRGSCMQSPRMVCVLLSVNKSRHENLVRTCQDCLCKLLQSVITNLKSTLAKLIEKATTTDYSMNF